LDTRNVVARFEAERQALALMDHPNIARVLDGGATDSGRPYFVMELVRGVPITEYCDKNHLPTQQRLDLFTQVCHAVQHAHQKGVIHRDIKPSNILVTLNDGVPLPMVIDFGIAKATSQKLTEKTLFTNYAQMIGTPAYMSPEQAEMSKLDVDTRTDIYSLGVLLYELLTGTTPFPAKELLSMGYGQIQRIIAEQEPLRPSTRLSTMANEERTVVAKNRSMDASALGKIFRGDLDWIVMKCLEKDRARRYETANGLAADLKRHLNNEPVVARPPSTAYKLQKAWRRNKVVFTAVASVAAALVVGFTVSIWQAVRASREAERATNAEQKAIEKVAVAQAEKARADRERERANLQLTNAERYLYQADMALLQPAWEQNRFDRVRQFLKETATCPQRGFEWYYWQRQTHLEFKTLRGHLRRVSAVAFSPDGQRIATSSLDETAKVWEAASGKELLAFTGHSSTIYSVAFSPDSQRIVTGSADNTAKLWQAATPAQVAHWQAEEQAAAERMAPLDRERLESERRSAAQCR
jgi:hypothetical protein